MRSDDGKVAVWVGAVDDLWSFGKPIGEGGPWKDTVVTAGQRSDPYLMTGYDQKHLTLSHRSFKPVRVRVEVDVSGTGKWVEYARFDVPRENRSSIGLRPATKPTGSAYRLMRTRPRPHG